MHSSQRWLVPIGIMLMVLLIGCGHNDGSASGSGTGGSPTGSGNGVTPTSNATPSGPASRPTQPSSQPPTSGVILQVGAASYTPGSTVHVTIKNQSNQAINFADHLTNCTVLTVQRQVGGSWQAMAPCRLEIMTRLHTLNAGASLDVSINTAGPWPAGVYRARLDFRSGSDIAPPGGGGTVYSSEFSLA